MYEGTLFSTPSPGQVVCRLPNHGHSDRCEVVPPNSLDLNFSPSDRRYSIIWGLVCLWLCGLGQCLFRAFANFSIGLLVLFCFWGGIRCWAGYFETPPWPGFGNQIKCLQVVLGKLVKGKYFDEQLCLSPCFSLKRSPESLSVSFHVSLFFPSQHVVGRPDLKPGQLNKFWEIDIKKALREIPPGSLHQNLSLSLWQLW